MKTESDRSHHTQLSSHSDEVDLVELMHLLLRRKVLIVFFAVLGLGLAAVYAYSAKPMYQASITIRPPSVSSLGGLVQAVGTRPFKQDETIMSQALELSDSIGEMLKRNLMSAALQSDFEQAHAPQNLSVAEDREFCRKLTPTKDRQACNNIVLSVTGHDRLALKPFIDAYLVYGASITAEEANSFLISAGVVHHFESTDLYRVDRGAAVPEAPINPKKPMLMVIGFILGALFGVCLALIGGVWQKNRQRTV